MKEPTKRLPRDRRRPLYYWYTPARLVFTLGWAAIAALASYEGYGALVRYGAGTSLMLTSVLALYAYRQMHVSRHEAPMLQEAHTSTPPPYAALGLVLVVLTLLGTAPPPYDPAHAVVYGIVGWFGASLNFKSLTIFLSWRLGLQGVWVARTPFWFWLLRRSIPGSDEDGFFRGGRG